MKHRRNLLIAVGASALAAPLATLAQVPAKPSGKPWRVGILPGGLLAPRKFQWDAFSQRMRELGYVEGKNVQYEIRAPDKEGAPYDALAANLVRLDVDVIVAIAAVAIGAAKRATQRIPIVMCPSADPVSEGFVASLRRPGGNLTGVTILSDETTGKRLQLLREMAPKAVRVAFVWDTPPPGNNWRPPRVRRVSLGCSCKAWKSTRPTRCRPRSRPPSRAAPTQ